MCNGYYYFFYRYRCGKDRWTAKITDDTPAKLTPGGRGTFARTL